MANPRRTPARVLALQAMCALESHAETFDDELSGFLHDPVHHADLGWTAPPASDLLRFARELASGTWHSRARYDELLARHMPDWSPQRLQPIDRNILRLGVYELLEVPETPPAVVIDEAIELARQFGSNDAPAFVNGVLDAIRRSTDAPAAAPDVVPGAGPQEA